jgi:hypothetical protein
MRIGLDFDGTIAAWGSAMDRWMREQTGRPLEATRDVREQLDGDRLREMIRTIMAGELTLAMEPVPGALEAIERLSANHELRVVTARYDYEALWARRWLEQHGLGHIPLEYTDRGPKIGCCDRLGLSVMLDDTPAVLVEVAGTATLPVLLHSRFGAAIELPARVRTVPDWPMFEDVCAEVAGTVAG